MQVVGYDELDRPIASTPSGLEKLDIEEVLRHRHLGVFGDAPGHHFLGGSDDITFGGNGGALGECWRRSTARSQPREAGLWQDAYREIGRICSCLNLPSYVRNEMTRIYVNLREQGLAQRTRSEKTLAKIAWLACLIHRRPWLKAEINGELKKLYGHGIGKISCELVKAANFRLVKFYTRKEGRYQYLRRYENANGKPVNYVNLGKL